VCTDGVPVGGEPREVRCYQSSEQVCLACARATHRPPSPPPPPLQRHLTLSARSAPLASRSFTFFTIPFATSQSHRCAVVVSAEGRIPCPTASTPQTITCADRSCAQAGACTYARGPFEPTMVREVPCDNNITNCDEKTNLVWYPPEDTGGTVPARNVLVKTAPASTARCHAPQAIQH
jgi:hypothetical protein